MSEAHQGIGQNDIIRFLNQNRGFLDNFVNAHVQATRLENWLNEKLVEELSSELSPATALDATEEESNVPSPRNHCILRAPTAQSLNNTVNSYRCKILKKYGIRRSCHHRACSKAHGFTQRNKAN